MMLDPLKELFSDLGEDINEYLELIQLEPNYQVRWENGEQITVSSNMARFGEELERFETGASAQFYKYFAKQAELYRLAEKRFIDRNFDKVTDFISPFSALQLLKMGVLGRLAPFARRYFKNEKLVQLFTFQSMYLGVSPYDAPAVYSIISYMETGKGIWYPKGGMHALPRALEKLCKSKGVTFHYDTAVSEIAVVDGAVTGVILDNADFIKADKVVANSDLPYVYTELLKAEDHPKTSNESLAKKKQASSAVLFYWGVDANLEGLLHHNVYLSENFKQNLDSIFHEGIVPVDPSFYLYVPTKSDPNLAPKGKHILYVLVPVPNIATDVDWDIEVPRIKQWVLEHLKSHFDLDVEKQIESEAIFKPQDFKERFNLTDGSAFGLSHTFFQTGAFRPRNKDRDIDGLFFAGASTTPGSGVPMVLLSGKHAAQRILQEEKE